MNLIGVSLALNILLLSKSFFIYGAVTDANQVPKSQEKHDRVVNFITHRQQQAAKPRTFDRERRDRIATKINNQVNSHTPNVVNKIEPDYARHSQDENARPPTPPIAPPLPVSLKPKSFTKNDMPTANNVVSPRSDSLDEKNRVYEQRMFGSSLQKQVPKPGKLAPHLLNLSITSINEESKNGVKQIFPISDENFPHELADEPVESVSKEQFIQAGQNSNFDQQPQSSSPRKYGYYPPPPPPPPPRRSSQKLISEPMTQKVEESSTDPFEIKENELPVPEKIQLETSQPSSPSASPPPPPPPPPSSASLRSSPATAVHTGGVHILTNENKDDQKPAINLERDQVTEVEGLRNSPSPPSPPPPFFPTLKSSIQTDIINKAAEIEQDMKHDRPDNLIYSAPVPSKDSNSMFEIVTRDETDIGKLAKSPSSVVTRSDVNQPAISEPVSAAQIAPNSLMILASALVDQRISEILKRRDQEKLGLIDFASLDLNRSMPSCNADQITSELSSMVDQRIMHALERYSKGELPFQKDQQAVKLSQKPPVLHSVGSVEGMGKPVAPPSPPKIQLKSPSIKKGNSLPNSPRPGMSLLDEMKMSRMFRQNSQ